MTTLNKQQIKNIAKKYSSVHPQTLIETCYWLSKGYNLTEIKRKMGKKNIQRTRNALKKMSAEDHRKLLKEATKLRQERERTEVDQPDMNHVRQVAQRKTGISGRSILPIIYYSAKGYNNQRVGDIVGMSGHSISANPAPSLRELPNNEFKVLLAEAAKINPEKYDEESVTKLKKG